MSAGASRSGPVSPKQHLLNLVLSLGIGLATLIGTKSFPWAAVAFLVAGIMIHTLQLGAKLGKR